MKPPVCSRCHYDLAGLASVGNCPHCGQRYSVARDRGILTLGELDVLDRKNAEEADAQQHLVSRSVQRWAVRIGVAVGVAASVAAMGLAMLFAGAGHGSYAFAWYAFPIPMWLASVSGSIDVIAILLALIQFPLYGAALGWSLRSARRMAWTVVGIIMAHGVPVAAVVMRV